MRQLALPLPLSSFGLQQGPTHRVIPTPNDPSAPRSTEVVIRLRYPNQGKQPYLHVKSYPRATRHTLFWLEASFRKYENKTTIGNIIGRPNIFQQK